MTIPVAHPTITNYSLNGTWRKKEYDRIERENHQFATRLFQQKSDVSKKTFDNEYKNTKRYRKIIRRVDPTKSLQTFSPRPKTQDFTCSRLASVKARINAHKRVQSSMGVGDAGLNNSVMMAVEEKDTH